MLVQQVAGGTVKWSQLPVYLAAELLAGVVAALAYGALVKGSDTIPAESESAAAPAAAELPALSEPAARA
jgi:glycerol uptake facilitator protein